MLFSTSTIFNLVALAATMTTASVIPSYQTSALAARDDAEKGCADGQFFWNLEQKCVAYDGQDFPHGENACATNFHYNSHYNASTDTLEYLCSPKGPEYGDTIPECWAGTFVDAMYECRLYTLTVYPGGSASIQSYHGASATKVYNPSSTGAVSESSASPVVESSAAPPPEPSATQNSTDYGCAGGEFFWNLEQTCVSYAGKGFPHGEAPCAYNFHYNPYYQTEAPYSLMFYCIPIGPEYGDTLPTCDDNKHLSYYECLVNSRIDYYSNGLFSTWYAAGYGPSHTLGTLAASSATPEPTATPDPTAPACAI